MTTDKTMASSSPARNAGDQEEAARTRSQPLEAQRLEQRKHIDSIRRSYERLACKTPDDQEIQLTFHSAGHFECAILTLRSGARNALSGRMISQLTERLDELERWAAAAATADEPPTGPATTTTSETDCDSGATRHLGLLLVGANGTFCSGSDLVSVRGTLGEGEGLRLAQVMQYNLQRIQELPLVSVALVEGYALGGGAELALAPDFRLMADGAQIGFVHARVGVCCGWGGGTRLVQLVGPNRAFELLSSGRLVGAREALALGLSNRTLEAAQAPGAAAGGGQQHLEAALEFVRLHSISGGSPGTRQAIRALISAATSLPRAESLRAEAQLFASTWGRPAHLRALAANVRHNRAKERGGGGRA